MIYKIKIQKIQEKPFKNNDGDEVPYFWLTGERLADGCLMQIGSASDFGGASAGETIEVDAVKYERKDGKFGYKVL